MDVVEKISAFRKDENYKDFSDAQLIEFIYGELNKVDYTKYMYKELSPKMMAVARCALEYGMEIHFSDQYTVLKVEEHINSEE